MNAQLKQNDTFMTNKVSKQKKKTFQCVYSWVFRKLKL